MNGDIGWSGVCGVPGLGCSVKNKYNYVPALRLWEDNSDPQKIKNMSKKEKNHQSQSQSLGDKIVSMFSLKRRNTMKAPESVVSPPLPKVSVRRSNTISSVSPKLKSGPPGPAHCDRAVTMTNIRRAPSSLKASYVCESCVSSSRPGLTRSVSYHQKKEAGGDRSLSSPHRRLQKKKVARASTNIERCDSKKTICQSRSTQTEPDHYDYAYSATPGRPGATDEGDGGNIYEEIIPPHRRLFFSISQGRRDNLELYKFADWDLEDKLRPKTDKVMR